MFLDKRMQLYFKKFQFVGMMTKKQFFAFAASNQIKNLTARRDLALLEHKKIISLDQDQIVWLKNNEFVEPHWIEGVFQNIIDKQQIVAKACTLLQSNKSLFVSAGTTTGLVFDYIKQPISDFYTNSLMIFNKSQSCDYVMHHHLVGGRFRNLTTAFIGSETLAALQKLQFDMAIITVTSFTEDLELYSNDPKEAEIVADVLKRTKNVIVVCDYTKLNTTSYTRIGTLKQGDIFITNKEVAKSFQKHISALAPKVYLV